MKATIRLTLAGLLALIPTWGMSWWAFPVSETVWEVIADVGTSAADFWCGAGDYAQRVMGVPAASRIYIWKPVGPSVNVPGRKAVQFSMSPPPGADTSVGYSLTVKRAGDNLARHAAVQYCFQYDGPDIWERW
jgi:hypothetical protein